MDKLGNSILPIEVIDDRTIQPYELLQVNIEGLHEDSHNHPSYIPSTHHSVFHPDVSPETSRIETCHKLMRAAAGFSDIDPDRWRFFGHYNHPESVKSLPDTNHHHQLHNHHHHNNTSSSSNGGSGTTESHAQKRAKRCIQQRMRRVNESNEEKESRRQKNRELNRRRRANLDDIGIATEKSRNRLRQRVKREITRMVRTGEKRDDFLKETFGDVENFFSKEEYTSLYQRVLDTIDFIQNRKK